MKTLPTFDQFVQQVFIQRDLPLPLLDEAIEAAQETDPDKMADDDWRRHLYGKWRDLTNADPDQQAADAAMSERFAAGCERCGGAATCAPTILRRVTVLCDGCYAEVTAAPQ